ncbi:anthranilate phosphoribosyltransferase [Aliiglaciecola sp. CAU 1673]|uniref:anthranilate phosphoribosyltransferase n=1 Tax=Aliiglaciecola sp. CAU 1673 TaxID=3032595 RepID=UPI0023DB4EF8|nr:anthranilate phosphoribosyltransferase [Aliiglaciecola sp. CAU 1673]MDF2178779.1 anthranilate phosphoribosyltransferase [Aliiglaciecola sp. CAU 1673]
MIHTLLEQLYQGQPLQTDQVKQLFDDVVTGNMEPILLSSLLTALKMKGETPQEIAGAALALAGHAAPFPRPDYAFADIVGTGGDGHNTLNVSSASAVVAAACGVKVAKHGNRSVSSRSGSADLFREFGLNLEMSAEVARRCLDKSGFSFLFAPNYHGGIRHAMPVRTALKTRTLFNLLGPLVNPARPSHLVIGVYLPQLLKPFAETLKLLGYRNALVVHGSGLDELALHGPSSVAELKDDDISYYQLTPADFGLDTLPLEAIKGGEPAHNKQLIEQLLAGRGEIAHQHAVAINAGALLKVCGAATTWQDGADKVLQVLKTDNALTLLQTCAKTSREEY